MHNRLQSPRNNDCKKQSETDISSDFHFIGSHETPHNENFLSENPYEMEQSNVFQTLSPQKKNNPNKNTRNYARFPSNQRGLFHTDPTTFSHVINRGFPRNAEASGVRSIHSPMHSTPCFEPKAESPEICSQNQFNVFRKERKPDKYDGKNVEWPDYLRHFEQVALWNRWSDSEKAIQLAMSLRGTAQRIVSELSPKQLSNYDSLKLSLAQRFCPSERKTAHRCEFRARRRLRGETVSDYGYALNRLANRAFPNIPMFSREDLIIDQYISGLGDLEIKKYVQFAHPSTLDKAISLAVEFEAFEGAHNKVLSKPLYTSTNTQIQTAVRAVQNSSKTSESLVSDDSVLSELSKTTKEIQSAVNELKSAKNRDSTLSSIRCFTCGKPGHTSRQCAERNRKSPKQTNNRSDSRPLHKNNPNATGLSLRPEVQSRKY